jgi:hypothetical protein
MFNASPITSGENGFDYAPQGAMANTPYPGWGYREEQRQTTPIANAAAMRGYTRNAPYMEELVSSPQAMFGEMADLYDAAQKNPNDVVSAYRLRILKQAVQDIYNLQAPKDSDWAKYRPSSTTETAQQTFRPFSPTTPGSK